MGRYALLILLSCAALGSAEPGRSEPTIPAVVYERDGDLFAVSVDGAKTLRLTRTRVEELDPAVSPDGSMIAFTDSRFDLWTMNVDGSGRRIVTRGGTEPAWAPDGKTIYFIRFRAIFGGELCGSIFRVAATGGRAYRITRSSGVYSHRDPAVSPDGQRIAFSAWKGCAGGTSSPRLRVVDALGRRTDDLAKLPRNGFYPDPEHSSPAWSPDGERLAFRRNSDLAIARRDGLGERRLVRGSGSLIYEAPAWSPDGRWIAFSMDSPSFATLRLVHPDGTGLRRLARNARGDTYSVGGWLPRLPS